MATIGLSKLVYTMGRHAKVRPGSGKEKEYLAARQKSAKYFTPTTTTTSEAAGESSNTAENVTEEERRSRERIRLLGSATKLRKQVLGSVAERDRISTRDSGIVCIGVVTTCYYLDRTHLASLTHVCSGSE
jgi:hypothetical protein